MFNQWILPNKNLTSLTKDLKIQDLESWNFMVKPDVHEFVKNSLIGAKKFLLNEKLEDLPKARKNSQRYL